MYVLLLCLESFSYRLMTANIPGWSICVICDLLYVCIA